MAHIFVSHSSRDAEQAERLLAWLRSQGFDQAFLDFDKHTGIAPGSEWEKTLYREIARAEAVLLILTKNWFDSKWCFVEFAQARALGKAIFPLIETPRGDTYVASDIQNLDLTNDRAGGLGRLGAELTRIALNAQGEFPWDTTRPPFPGLLAFDEADAAIYFGRDDDIRRLIERLNARRAQGGARLVALLGGSGSGKSSLMRAGLLPRLKRDKRNWLVLPPFRPQFHPVDELAQVVAIGLGQPTEWRTWRDRLSGSDALSHLSDLARDLRAAHGSNEAQILIPIDQGEELFSTEHKAEAEQFFALLKGLLDERLPFLALLAMRSDYLGQLQQAAGSTAALEFEEFSLKPMPLERVREIIEGPARVVGLTVEDGLISAAIKDAATDDALPLLAFALRELYDRFGNDQHLALSEYQSFRDEKEGLNPLENAVRRRAEDVLAEAKPGPDDFQALKEAFVPAMVRVNAEGEYVRRPARLDELPARAQPLLERLAKARLLVIRMDGDARVVEVVHEALLRKWPLLRGWLDQEREFLIGKEQLTQDLRDWQNASDAQKKDALLGGPKLARARLWLVGKPHQLTEGERAYIQQSIENDEAKAKRSVRIRRTVLAVSLAATVVLAIVAGAAVLQRNEAQAQRSRAEQELARTELALQSTMQIANTLVFDLGQKFQARGMPVDLVGTMLDGAINGFDQSIQLDPKNATAYYGRGGAYWVKGDYDRAVKDFDQAIELDPKYADAYFGRGLTYARKGDKDHVIADYDLAIADYDQAIQNDPKRTLAYHARGNAYASKSDYDRAIADYDQAIQLDPDEATLYYDRALARANKNENDRAIADYDRAIQLNPKYLDAYNNRGDAYAAKGDYDRAFANYDQAIQLDPRYVAAYFSRGNAYLNRGDGDSDLAIAAFDQAIQIDPKYVLAYHGRGLAYAAKGDYDNAVADYDQAIQLDPKDAKVYYHRGVAYAAKDDNDLAIADFDQAIQLDPKYATAYQSRGVAYAAKGDNDRAIADYDQAIQLDPKDVTAYQNRGRAYAAKGDNERALADYDQAIQLDPKNAWTYSNRGIIYAAKGDNDRAIADYNQAIALDPKNVTAYQNRGRAYAIKGDNERAIADYDQAIQLDPKDAWTYRSRGIVYATKGDNDRAIVDYDQAIELDPKNVTAYQNRGAAYAAKGDDDRAIADYAQAIKLDPKYLDAYFNRGLAYLRKSDNDRAIADFDQAIQINPKYVAAYQNRGAAYAGKGDNDRAIADYNRAIELDPRDAWTYNSRGLAHAAKDDYDHAIADYDRAIALDPKDALTYYNRGLAYLRKGDHDRAIVDFDQAIQIDPKNALAYGDRGLAYLRKGDNDRAIADFGQAIELDPNNANASYNRGLAYFSQGTFSAAAADFLSASAIAESAYPMLWRFLALGHMGENGEAELAASAVRLKNKDWPYPVIELDLGRLSPAALLAAASKPDERCEAQFYSGEWHLLHDNGVQAAVDLQAAADSCPKSFSEYAGAVAELKRLNR